MVRRSANGTANEQGGQVYLTVDEVAEILGVPRSFVYRRTCRGASDPIVHYRFGGHLRFLRRDVDEWITNNRVERPAIESPFEFDPAWMPSWADSKSTEADAS
ncbi:MAG: helix-turn-helix domain-containing protein [Actinobacteria bacterium]|nr:helix-turn-helix domain-containing protein [Actinomycetota bacterium]